MLLRLWEVRKLPSPGSLFLSGRLRTKFSRKKNRGKLEPLRNKPPQAQRQAAASNKQEALSAGLARFAWEPGRGRCSLLQLPASPDVSIPNPASPTAPPTPVVTQTPAGAVMGQTAAAGRASKTLEATTRGQLQEAIDGGVAGIKMNALLDRLHTLAHLADLQGAGQIPGWASQWLVDHKLAITDRAAIMAEMQSEFNAQIPELRKDMGVKFEAGPELSAQGKMIGNPSLPTQVIDGILARQKSIADLGIQRRNLAIRTLQPGADQPLALPDYYKQENALYDNLGTEMQKQLQDYGAYGTESKQPPPIATAPTKLAATSSRRRWTKARQRPG